MTPRSIIAETAAELLKTRARVTVSEVVHAAYDKYPGVFFEAAKNLAHERALKIAKEVMGGYEDEDTDAGQGQLDIGLPSVIATPGGPDGEYIYVRLEDATWSELLAGRDVRADNVTRAQARLDRYDRALGRLRPYMEDAPTLTVGGAMRAAGA